MQPTHSSTSGCYVPGPWRHKVFPQCRETRLFPGPPCWHMCYLKHRFPLYSYHHWFSEGQNTLWFQFFYPVGRTCTLCYQVWPRKSQAAIVMEGIYCHFHLWLGFAEFSAWFPLGLLFSQGVKELRASSVQDQTGLLTFQKTNTFPKKMPAAPPCVQTHQPQIHIGIGKRKISGRNS